MRAVPSSRSLVFALYANAALLAAILLVLLGRAGAAPGFDSAAFAQAVPQPIAGGAGFYVMPAQFETNKWGCYVMDVDAQRLVAYVYDRRAGDQVPQLRLAAARSFSSDRLLQSYNTFPPPSSIAEIVKNERESRQPVDESSAGPATQPSTND